ncbi:MAG: cell division topological specificity factor MinE [Clostridiales bacterium]|nr:cell division topological specificity factor MinE [Clostridiales bacterium]
MDMFNLRWRRHQSRKYAKDRLKVVLVNDRASCSNQVLEMLKNDIVKALNIYMDIDADELDIQITQTPVEDSQGEYMPMLNANIPIKSIRKFKEQLIRRQ